MKPNKYSWIWKGVLFGVVLVLIMDVFSPAVEHEEINVKYALESLLWFIPIGLVMTFVDYKWQLRKFKRSHE